MAAEQEPGHNSSTFRRDLIETRFAELLQTMTPTRELFEIAHHMFRSLWDGKMESAGELASNLKTELIKVDRNIEQLLDRVLEVSNPSLVQTYETRIGRLENEKALIRERIANCGRPLGTFDEKFRTAIAFLGNPYKLWVSPSLEDKRAVLKMTVADRLTYSRNDGFRTAVTSSPFKIISQLGDRKSGMVRLQDSISACIYLLLGRFFIGPLSVAPNVAPIRGNFFVTLRWERLFLVLRFANVPQSLLVTKHSADPLVKCPWRGASLR